MLSIAFRDTPFISCFFSSPRTIGFCVFRNIVVNCYDKAMIDTLVSLQASVYEAYVTLRYDAVSC